MKITVIGTGSMGSAFVRQLTGAGHQVSVTARDPSKAQQLAAAHPGARAVPAAGAAEGADAVVLATGYGDAASGLRAAGAGAGTVVIDITNPLTADYMGLTIGHGTSAAEEIAKAVPGAEVVKAFNTVFAQVLAEGPDFGQGRQVDVFVASDSERAKQTARAIAESLGFNVVDAGPLKNARYLEPVAGLNIYLGYGAGQGTAIAPVWIRKN
ncbi:NADPH-dependent F420 reductase [Ramlibacter alkalitolerans]|uniref:NAD(P)-binding domain-containing protein n=1 Tax=Ramlibacter alkalitolerans TaxID=2039631 RepID=A0ABS1JTA9_9BURK|nr:NAD(P)-binding domain-containing protein [Ramlibacter alkalitolerans]MBL0427484.1 NAD(P)-binding domain-containing protein [Ramlibacter alkalitolerans]